MPKRMKKQTCIKSMHYVNEAYIEPHQIADHYRDKAGELKALKREQEFGLKVTYEAAPVFMGNPFASAIPMDFITNP